MRTIKSRPRSETARRLSVAAVVVSLLGVAGCDLFTEPAETPLSVEVPPTLYLPGSTASVTLRNGSDQPWFYLAGCAPELQRLDAGRWVPALDMACLAELQAVEIPAGDSLRLDLLIPVDAQPGLHRLRARFNARADLGGRTETRVSAGFEVFLFSLGAGGE